MPSLLKIHQNSVVFLLNTVNLLATSQQNGC